MIAQDPDIEWLARHLPPTGAPNLHEQRVSRILDHMDKFIKAGRLPMTLGLFGGWGSGKTTLLAILAQKLSAEWKSREFLSERKSCELVYFNAWKYAGFMEIVPSLIYKILCHGNYDRLRVEPEVIAKIMTSLGKDYADKIGDWVEKFLGINPVDVMVDAGRIRDTIKNGASTVQEAVIDAYYSNR